MSLRSAYGNIFTPIPDASGNFSGQINQNLPGNLYVGSNGQEFKVYINGIELSGTGGGGGGGDIADWATKTANNPVNIGGFNLYNFESLNAIPLTITTGTNKNSYGGSNIFAIGEGVDTTFSNDTVILYALGPSAARGNSSNHVFAFGLNSAYRNSGNNLFAAGIGAGTSNNGANVIAIGNGAAFQNMSDNVIAIGVSAGYGNRSSDVIAIGRGAGYNNSGNYSIFLGSNPNTSLSNNGDYRFLVYSSEVGNPFMFGDLKYNRLCINGSSFVSNYNFTVNGTTYLDGTTKIGRVVTVESEILQVNSNARFLSNVENVGVVSMSNNLNVSGLTTLSGANIQNRLNVSGIVSLQNNLNVSGIVSLQSNLNVSGTGAFTGAVSLQNNLNVSGSLAVQSNASVGGTLTVPTVSSLTTLNGTVNFLTPVGTVTMYAGTTAPTGWLLCDGTSYLRSTYPALSTVIGSNFSGTPTNFNVPDLRSRFPIGASSTFPINNPSGSLTQTLTSNNLPVHNHPSSASISDFSHSHTVFGRRLTHTLSDPGHNHTFNFPQITDNNGGGAIDDAGGGGTTYSINSNTTGITVGDHVIPDAATGGPSTTPAVSVTVSNSTNSNNAFSILNPCIALNYIIKF